nr:piggyBac transposable element-derived protein 2-like [Dermacentor andersoni]
MGVNVAGGDSAQENSASEKEESDSDSDEATPTRAKGRRAKSNRFLWKHTDISLPESDLEYTGGTYLPTSVLELGTPYSFFHYIFTPELLHTITEQSCLYSTQTRTEKPISITESDMETFVGSLLWTTLIHLPSTRMYWNSKFYISQVAILMPVNRWQEIKSSIHFANNTAATPKDSIKSDRQYKIRPLLESIKERCLSVPFQENLSVDEQVCAFKGRSVLKQYNPKKPHRWGYKIFVLSGISGFPYNFEPYSGRENVITDGMVDCGAIGNDVLRLTSPVPCDVRHKVYFDNYFNSPKLQITLAKTGILSLGTIRANRLPGCPIKSEKELKMLGRGASDEVCCTAEGVELSCVRWHANRAVTFLSSFAGRSPMQKARHWFSTSKTFREVDCPRIVQIYNKHMGGVDRLDSLLGLYRIRVRLKKWYFRVFTRMLDLSVVAAWLLNRRVQAQLGESDSPPLAQFKAEIADCLTSYNKCVAAKRPGRPPSQSIDLQLQAEKSRGPMAAVPPKDVRADQMGHCPNLTTIESAASVHFAKKKSSVRCSKCKVNLCLNSGSNCYVLFHEAR